MYLNNTLEGLMRKMKRSSIGGRGGAEEEALEEEAEKEEAEKEEAKEEINEKRERGKVK